MPYSRAFAMLLIVLSASLLWSLGTPNSGRLSQSTQTVTTEYETYSSHMTTNMVYNYANDSYYDLTGITKHIYNSNVNPDTLYTMPCQTNVADSMGYSVITTNFTSYPPSIKTTILDSQERMVHYSQALFNPPYDIELQNYYGSHSQPDSIRWEVIRYNASDHTIYSHSGEKWLIQYDNLGRKNRVDYYDWEDYIPDWHYLGYYTYQYAEALTHPLDLIRPIITNNNDLPVFDMNYRISSILFHPEIAHDDTLLWTCTSTNPLTYHTEYLYFSPYEGTYEREYRFDNQGMLIHSYNFYDGGLVRYPTQIFETDYVWTTGVPNSDETTTPSPLLLCSASPSPFSSATAIHFSLKSPGLVSLKVYNLKGQLVRHVDSGYKAAGSFSAAWNGKDEFNKEVSTGIYFVRLEQGNHTETVKVLKVK